MTEEEKEINGIEKRLKIERIQSILFNLKSGLALFQVEVDKIEKAIEELKDLSSKGNPPNPEVETKQVPLFAEKSSRTPTIKRINPVSSEGEKQGPENQYNIQVVGLGVEKI